MQTLSAPSLFIQVRLPDACTSLVAPPWHRSLGVGEVQTAVTSATFLKKVLVSTDAELREALASASAGTWVLLEQQQYLLSASLEIKTPNLTLSTSSSFSVSSWAAIATAPAGERRSTLTCGDGVGTAIVVRYISRWWGSSIAMSLFWVSYQPRLLREAEVAIDADTIAGLPEASLFSIISFALNSYGLHLAIICAAKARLLRAACC